MMEIYTDKMAGSGRRMIRRAYDEARFRDHRQLVPEHLLLSIARSDMQFFDEVMQSLGLDRRAVTESVECRLGPKLSEGDYPGRCVRISEATRALLRNALEQAHNDSRQLIEAHDLFIALFKDSHGYPVELLQRLGAHPEMIIQRIRTRARLVGNSILES